MALRDKLRDRVQPLLGQGENLQQVFLALSGPNPNLIFLSYLFLFFNKYKIVAVTDRGIVIFRAGIWRPAVPKSLQERLPRSTTLGPVSGAIWSSINLPGKRTWVHRRFYNDVRAADAGANTQSTAPSLS
jgi:hypothetical protein